MIIRLRIAPYMQLLNPQFRCSGAPTNSFIGYKILIISMFGPNVFTYEIFITFDPLLIGVPFFLLQSVSTDVGVLTRFQIYLFSFFSMRLSKQ